uniref:Uncharacterized protein n=1 Tax=Anguilla anguilla TaxID=7936 RepID=A0A0E9UDD4_ANGAN
MSLYMLLRVCDSVCVCACVCDSDVLERLPVLSDLFATVHLPHSGGHRVSIT